MSEFTGNPRVAPTAYFTSRAWIEAGFEYAELFDSRLGTWMYRALDPLGRIFGFLGPAVRYHNEYLFIRHHVYESRLREMKPGCIVEIGAGLSPRGIAFAASNPDLRYIEADLAGMVAAKKRMLAGFETPPNYYLGAADLLSNGFVDSLPAHPRPGDRVAVVTEGVTDYLKMDEKRIAFQNLSGFLRSSGGGSYLLDIYARELFPPQRIPVYLFVRGLGRLVGRSFDEILFDRVEQARRFLVECGFDTADVLDLDALNGSSFHPPLSGCTYRILEAAAAP